MNCPDGPVADPEAATDQLVDEICQRLASLYSLVDLSLAHAGPPVAEIRTCATEIVGRLTLPAPRALAVSITRALWPAPSGVDVPPTWWRTPLGSLIAQSLGTRATASASMTSGPS
jgi:hypothetical protein